MRKFVFDFQFGQTT